MKKAIVRAGVAVLSRRRVPLRPGTALLLAGAVFLLAVPALLFANGGALRLANVVMGDYRVSVFTDPTPPRPDSLDVSVLVLQEGAEGVPAGLDVTVRAELLEAHGEHAAGDREGPRTVRATREQADDPRYYAAKFPLGAEGRWRITVAVRGEDGEGEASFEIRARERGPLGHPATLVLLALLPLVGAAWWVLRGEEERPVREGGYEDGAAPRDVDAAPPSDRSAGRSRAD